MSVIVIGRVPVNPDNLAKIWAERPADFASVAEDAKAQGAVHHQWGFGDGEVLIIDEWSDAAAFQNFFSSQPMIPELMAAAGVTGEPKFEIFESRQGPDTF